MYGNRKGAVMNLAKKEFMDNIRSKWVLLVSLLFIGVTLLVSVYETVQPGSSGGLKSIAMYSSLVITMISIIAIIMGYKTVVNEVESKSIGLLLTSELSRKDILTGKLIGLSAVITLSIVGGLGIGGIVVGFNQGYSNVDLYLSYMVMAVLFGLAYLSISMFMSSLVSRKSRALAGGVFIWIVFNFIWDFIMIGVLMATGWEMPESVSEVSYPTWYYFGTLFNPNGSFSMTMNKLTGNVGDLPQVMTYPVLLVALALWIVIPLVIGMIWFHRKDL